MAMTDNQKWTTWAKGWLDETDRSREAAYAAVSPATWHIAESAAWLVAGSAGWSAAWSSEHVAEAALIAARRSNVQLSVIARRVLG